MPCASLGALNMILAKSRAFRPSRILAICALAVLCNRKWLRAISASLLSLANDTDRPSMSSSDPPRAMAAQASVSASLPAPLAFGLLKRTLTSRGSAPV